MKLVEWMHSELIQHASAKAPNDEELMAVSLTELFQDFLITGTLGSTQPIIQVTEDYPSTPTFSISIYDEYSQDSSSEKYNPDSSVIETVEACENGEILCPLQSYLLATAVLPVTKERRLSLGELFQKTNVADECSGIRSDDGETQLIEKEANKSAAHFMRKLMLKKRMSHPSSGRTIGSLHKILHIFNRKVHPESSTFSYQSHTSTEKNEIMNNITHFPALKKEEIWPFAEDIKLYLQGATLKESTWNESHSTQFTRIRGDISARESWVKTDADYLVLEL